MSAKSFVSFLFRLARSGISPRDFEISSTAFFASSRHWPTMAADAFSFSRFVRVSDSEVAFETSFLTLPRCFLTSAGASLNAFSISLSSCSLKPSKIFCCENAARKWSAMLCCDPPNTGTISTYALPARY